MEISGPVAPPEPAPSRGGVLAGCLSGCMGALSAALAAAVAVVGGAYEVVQPAHHGTVRVDDGVCDVSWWRSATGGARYRVRCDARGDLELSSFKLLSGPRGVELVESVEDWGQSPWEDQRPMDGDTVTVPAGQSWSYDGTISLGVVPWVGPPATVAFSAVIDDRPVRVRIDE